jgi:hypothetical protein
MAERYSPGLLLCRRQRDWLALEHEIKRTTYANAGPNSRGYNFNLKMRRKVSSVIIMYRGFASFNFFLYTSRYLMSRFQLHRLRTSENNPLLVGGRVGLSFSE